MPNKEKKAKSKQVLLIKKANELIEAQYKFDIWETRAFLSVLAQIQRTDEEFKEYRIVYKNIMEDFDLKAAEAYNYLREAVLRLMSKRVHIRYEKDGLLRESVYTIFNKTDALLNENQQKIPINYDKQGYIDIAMHPDMRDLLLQLKKNFTTYDIKHITKLGANSIRIYELLKQYERIGQRKISIDKMKQMLELIAEYPTFASFYQRIVAPSIKEINKHTDLEVDTPEKIKEGRKVIALLFTFRKKENNAVPETEPSIDFANEVETAFETISSAVPPPPKVIVEPTVTPSVSINAPKEPVASPDLTEALYTEFETDVIKSFGVTPFVLVKLIENYDAELIRKQIRITKRKRGSSPTTNIAGFFVNAVKTDYNDPEEAKEAKKQANLEAKRKAQQAQIEAQQREAKRKERIEERKETVAMISKSVNNTIRKLVAKDPTVTDRAIAYATQQISTNATLRTTFDQLGYQLNQLDVAIWRKEPFLCQQVIEAMQKIEPQAFVYLSSLLEELEELELEIKSLA